MKCVNLHRVEKEKRRRASCLGGEMVLIVDEPLVQVGDESHQCKTHSRQCPHQLTAIPGGGKGPSGVVGADEDEAEQKEHREDVRGECGKLRNGEEEGREEYKEGRNTGEGRDECGKVNKESREEREEKGKVYTQKCRLVYSSV